MTEKAFGNSFQCPKCDGAVGVIDSRPTRFIGAQAIRRRRVCKVCDHRFTTMEIEADGGAATLAEESTRLLGTLRSETARLIAAYQVFSASVVKEAAE